MNSLVEILLSRHIQAPSGHAFSFVESEDRVIRLSNAQLLSAASNVVQSLCEHTQAGDRVVLLAPEGIQFIAGFFGCILAARVVVPTYPPLTSRVNRATLRLHELIKDAAPAAFLTTPDLAGRVSALLDQLGSHRAPVVEIDCASQGEDLSPNVAFAPASDSVAMVQYTSGSTSRPKGVMLTHRNLIENARGMQLHGNFDSDSISFSWLPPYHDMGLISGLVLPICVGYPGILCASRRFLARPVSWFESISQFRATVTGAPNFAFDYCVDRIQDRELENLDLSSLKAVFNGAEPIRVQTLKSFVDRFESIGLNPDSLSPVYGLAEGTLMVSGVPAKKPYTVRAFDSAMLKKNLVESAQQTTPATTLVSCGTPLANIQISICGPKSGDPLEEGRVGEICIEGPSVSPGYLNTGQISDRSSPDGQGHTSCRGEIATGDLGFISKGDLFVTGRLKDLIICRGRNIYPQDIEWSAGFSHPAVNRHRVCAFAIDDGFLERLYIVGEINRANVRSLAPESVVRFVIEAVTRDNQVTPDLIYLVKPGGIPLTTSGKVRRSECRERVVKNNLKPLYRYARPSVEDRNRDGTTLSEQGHVQRWSSSDVAVITGTKGRQRLETIEAYLREIVADLLGVSPPAVSSDLVLQDMGVDSLLVIELVYRINSDFGVELSSVPETEATLATLAKAIIAAPERSPAKDLGSFQTYQNVMPQVMSLSPLHQQMRFSGEPVDRYNISVYLRVPPALKSDSLKLLVERVLVRHAAFFLRLNSSGESWSYSPGQSGPLSSFELHKIRQNDPGDLEVVKDVVDAHRLQAFDLENGPLVRVLCIEDGRGKIKNAVMTFSHSVVDAASLWQLLAELQQKWSSGGWEVPDGAAEPIDETGLAFSRFLLKRAQGPEVQSQADYWMEQKADLLQALNQFVRATKVLGDTDSAAPANSVRERLLPEPSALIREQFVGADERHNLFLTALCRAWFEATGVSRCAVTLESHGRGSMTAPSLETGTVGWFTVRTPVVLETDSELSIWDDWQQVRSRLDERPCSGQDFGLLRYLCENCVIKEQFSDFPEPLVRFVYRGKMDERFRRSDHFKVIDVRVSRPNRSSPRPAQLSETSVFVREQADTFVIDIEHLEGSAYGGAVPTPAMLTKLMLQELRGVEPV